MTQSTAQSEMDGNRQAELVCGVCGSRVTSDERNTARQNLDSHLIERHPSDAKF